MDRSQKIIHTFAMEVKISATKKSENDIACIHKTNLNVQYDILRPIQTRKYFEPLKWSRIYIHLPRHHIFG